MLCRSYPVAYLSLRGCWVLLRQDSRLGVTLPNHPSPGVATLPCLDTASVSSRLSPEAALIQTVGPGSQ
jgi:hypothetical protein